MSKTKNCRKTCLKIDLENKSALSIFVSSNMKKNFLRRIFKTQLFLKSLGPYICVTHEILLHQSIGVTLASVEHSVVFRFSIRPCHGCLPVIPIMLSWGALARPQRYNALVYIPHFGESTSGESSVLTFEQSKGDIFKHSKLLFF